MLEYKSSFRKYLWNITKSFRDDRQSTAGNNSYFSFYKLTTVRKIYSCKRPYIYQEENTINTSEWNMFLKFTERQHFNSLVNSGSVRIGTLFGFQKSEAGEMVNDDNEGVKVFSGSYDRLTPDEVKKSSSLFAMMGEGVKNSYIENIKIINTSLVGENYYIFSVTDTYRRSQHIKWNEEEGYDICYGIPSSVFFDIITEELNKISPVTFKGIYQVNYYDERKGMDFYDAMESYPAFTLKDIANYSDQSEWRAVWEPESDFEIKPTIVVNKILQKHVKIIADLSSYLLIPAHIKKFTPQPNQT